MRNTALFKAVRVEQGGYAISWNDVIDISEYELWNHGQSMKYPIELDNLLMYRKKVLGNRCVYRSPLLICLGSKR